MLMETQVLKQENFLSHERAEITAQRQIDMYTFHSRHKDSSLINVLIMETEQKRQRLGDCFAKSRQITPAAGDADKEHHSELSVCVCRRYLYSRCSDDFSDGAFYKKRLSEFRAEARTKQVPY
ncbi:hypothetical protein EVAR_84481_1 [Eumeta japonica]|uniref:Uncharacterized protein n=1 Tax=Eumeta variegata TaxID=151549 RepID=A0A4C1SJ90_EUMVA|nr:hypothetical protein EVAR_84481_1 [Eumeta japonica]